MPIVVQYICKPKKSPGVVDATQGMAPKDTPMEQTNNTRNQIRRHLRHTNEGTLIYSKTRPGKDIQHKVTIDLEKGICECTCEDFRFRGRKSGRPCKHILQEARYMERAAKEVA